MSNVSFASYPTIATVCRRCLVVIVVALSSSHLTKIHTIHVNVKITIVIMLITLNEHTSFLKSSVAIGYEIKITNTSKL